MVAPTHRNVVFTPVVTTTLKFRFHLTHQKIGAYAPSPHAQGHSLTHSPPPVIIPLLTFNFHHNQQKVVPCASSLINASRSRPWVFSVTKYCANRPLFKPPSVLKGIILQAQRVFEA